MRLFALIIIFTLSATAKAQFPSSWRDAKNQLDDNVYNLNRHTFYCGCDYSSDRVWFYMETTHGVYIPAAAKVMFQQWAANDSVSPWEP